MEREKNCSLPFLDTFVTRLINGELDISVYRKPTHTDRYLNYSSHHPEHVKRGMVQCLFNRAEKLTKHSENLTIEQKHLTQVLKKNDYPKVVIRSAQRKRKDKISLDQQEQPRGVLMIPYISGLSEELRRVGHKYNIKTIFRTTRPTALQN